MFAHMIEGFTGPDDVLWTEVAEPAADAGVVIDVVAAGVSFADLLQTRGAYQMKVPVPYTPGMDAAVVRWLCRFGPQDIVRTREACDRVGEHSSLLSRTISLTGYRAVEPSR